MAKTIPMIECNRMRSDAQRLSAHQRPHFINKSRTTFSMVRIDYRHFDRCSPLMEERLRSEAEFKNGRPESKMRGCEIRKAKSILMSRDCV